MSSSSGLILLPLCFCGMTGLFTIFLASSLRIVPEAKRLSVFRMGKFIGEKGPGIVVLIPIIDKAISNEPGCPVRDL